MIETQQTQILPNVQCPKHGCPKPKVCEMQQQNPIATTAAEREPNVFTMAKDRNDEGLDSNSICDSAFSQQRSPHHHTHSLS